MTGNDKHPPLLRTFHWAMAVLLLAQISIGWFMTPYDPEREPLVGQLYFWHKSFGLLVLLLVIGRLATRLSTMLPPLPAGLPELDRRLAELAHRTLYALMFLGPITGYVLSSTYEYSDGITFFGLEVPELLEDNATLFEFADWAHAIIAYSMLALVIMHVAGVVKHRWFDSDRDNDVLSRML